MTNLTDYRLLGRSGLRVSPLALGAMTFGTEWGWGADADESLKILDRYIDAGGNFIDTANYYTGGTSERFLGEMLKERRNRVVLATKYSLQVEPGNPNAGGNSRLNLMRSLEASLARLKTDHIDLYWVHAWEHRTPIEEVLRAIDDAVRQGKIAYAGISDTPAWVISRANTLADRMGWTPFVATQVQYNLVERTPEAELTPMGQSLGVAIQPWSPLAGGVLSGKYRRTDLEKNDAEGRGGLMKAIGQLTERNLNIVDAVKSVATEVGATPSHVSLAWLLQRPGVTAPIIGARTLTQLEDNLGALTVGLSEEQVNRLDGASAPVLPFPHNFMATEAYRSAVDGEERIEGWLQPRP